MANIKKRIILEFFFIIIFIVGIYVLLILFVGQDGKKKINYSKDIQQKLGDVFKKKILEHYPKVKNPEILKSISIIQKQLAENIEKPLFQHEIIVIDAQDVNAFAIPGGYIFLTTSLLSILDRAEEAAAVIAHEIGHHENRHIEARIISTVGANALSVILGGSGNVILREILSNMFLSSFSRRQEKDADDYSINLLIDSSIKPYYLASAFRRLKQYNIKERISKKRCSGKAGKYHKNPSLHR